MGSACLGCFTTWKEVFRHEFESLEVLVQACSNPQVAARIDQAYKVHKNVEPKTCNPERVDKTIGCTMTLERSFVVLSESELRIAIGAGRLLKAHTRQLHQVSVPSEANPAVDERVYVFRDPERPYRRAVLSTSLAASSSTELMPASSACFAGQSRHSLRASWQGDRQDVLSLLNARLGTIDDFLVEHGSRVPSGGVRPHGEDASAASDDSDREDNGSSVVAPAGMAHSPAMKQRPVVPSFGLDPSPAKESAFGDRASERKSAKASSETGSKTGESDNEDLADNDSGGEGTGDVVVLWKKRLPLIDVFTGQPKGRTIKALRDKCLRLSGNDRTIDAANRLKNYMQAVTLAEQLRPERITKTPAAEVAIVVRTMIQEGVTMPASTGMLLLEHKVAHLIKAGATADELLDAIQPWQPASTSLGFNPEVPTLGALDIPAKAKVDKFKVLYWQTHLVPMLMNEAALKDTKLTAMLERLVERFEAEDVLEFDSAAAAALRESVVASQGLLAILSMAPDPSCEEALNAFVARRGKVDKSILTSVASAVFSSSHLSGRLTKLVAAMPAIKEYGPKMEQFDVSMVDADSAQTGLRRLADMCKVIGQASASQAADLFTKEAEDLSKRVIAAWNDLDNRITTGKLVWCGSLLDSVKACFDEAVKTFSAEDAMVEAKAEVMKRLRNFDSGARVELLRSAASQTFDLSTADAHDRIKALSSALHDVDGVDLPTDLEPLLIEVTSSLVASVAGWFENRSSDDQEVIKKAIDLCDSLRPRCKFSQPHAAAFALEMALWDMYRFMPSAAAPGGDGPEELHRKPSRESMHELGVSVQQVKHSLKATEDFTEGFIRRLQEVATDMAEQAVKATTEYYKGLLEASDGTIEECMTACRTAAHSLLDDGALPWHSSAEGGPKASWKEIERVAAMKLDPVDTRVLQTSLCDLNEAVAKRAQLEPFVGEAATLGADHATTLFHRRGSGLLHECLLVWHIRTETDAEELRRKVQTEVKAIRSLGYKERELLHPSVFKKSWASLNCIPP